VVFFRILEGAAEGGWIIERHPDGTAVVQLEGQEQETAAFDSTQETTQVLGEHTMHTPTKESTGSDRITTPIRSDRITTPIRSGLKSGPAFGTPLVTPSLDLANAAARQACSSSPLTRSDPAKNYTPDSAAARHDLLTPPRSNPQITTALLRLADVDELRRRLRSRDQLLAMREAQLSGLDDERLSKSVRYGSSNYISKII
jgi:hypothetical protein